MECKHIGVLELDKLVEYMQLLSNDYDNEDLEIVTSFGLTKLSDIQKEKIKKYEANSVYGRSKEEILRNAKEKIGTCPECVTRYAATIYRKGARNCYINLRSADKQFNATTDDGVFMKFLEGYVATTDLLELLMY